MNSEVSERLDWIYQDLANITAALQRAHGCAVDTIRDTEGTVDELRQAKAFLADLTENVVAVHSMLSDRKTGPNRHAKEESRC